MCAAVRSGRHVRSVKLVPKESMIGHMSLAKRRGPLDLIVAVLLVALGVLVLAYVFGVAILYRAWLG